MWSSLSLCLVQLQGLRNGEICHYPLEEHCAGLTYTRSNPAYIYGACYCAVATTLLQWVSSRCYCCYRLYIYPTLKTTIPNDTLLAVTLVLGKCWPPPRGFTQVSCVQMTHSRKPSVETTEVQIYFIFPSQMNESFH